MKHKRTARLRIMALAVLIGNLLAIIGAAGASEAFAAQILAESDIRVGLESLYANQGRLSVMNTKLGMGYCINGAYQIEETLYGTDGFLVTPDKQYYYRSKEQYATYAEAKLAAAAVQEAGVSALPVTITRNVWRVYACGAADAEQARQAAASAAEKKDKASLTIGGVVFSAEPEQSAYTIRIAGEEDILADAEENSVYPQFSSLTADESGAYSISLGERAYRGRLEFGRYKKSSFVTAVNVVPLEDYLYGVIPCEMPSSWPMEALKAQAVCARSFALKKAGGQGDTNLARGYYMGDTVSNQVYGGYTKETKRTNRAVENTCGETVCYDNQTIMAYYFSTSGGRTENAEDVWGRTAPYLRGVTDFYETSPEKEPWILVRSKTELAAELMAAGISIGAITDILPEIYTASGRVYSLKLKGTTGAVTLQESAIRDTLSLYSTKFKLIRYGDTPDLVTVLGAQGTEKARISECYVIDAAYQVRAADRSLEQYVVRSADNLTNFPQVTPSKESVYYFAGMGSGHGIGMSQSGAKGMAEAGYTYKEIIAYYFSGAQVQ